MEQCRVRKKLACIEKKKMFNLSRDILVIRVEAPLSYSLTWDEHLFNLSMCVFDCVGQFKLDLEAQRIIRSNRMKIW